MHIIKNKGNKDNKHNKYIKREDQKSNNLIAKSTKISYSYNIYPNRLI